MLEANIQNISSGRVYAPHRIHCQACTAFRAALRELVGRCDATFQAGAVGRRVKEIFNEIHSPSDCPREIRVRARRKLPKRENLVTEEPFEPSVPAATTSSTYSHSMSPFTVTVTWLLLVAATFLSWWLADDGVVANANLHQGSPLAIICLAMIKMYLILAVFMGMWRCPVTWHSAITACLAGTGALLILFVISP